MQGSGSNEGEHFDVVIVGGGIGAGACATTLRESGFSGSVAVICAEPHPPYTRPGLSKHVLRGEKPSSAALVRPEEWYAENDVTLLTGHAVTDIDRLGHTVRVAGRSIGFGHLVLATGAEPRSLPVAPEVRARMHVLRSFVDADRIRPLLGEGTSWLIVGGGFIGAEVAASARMTGSSATIVMPEPVVMQRAFGSEVGAWFERGLREHGVDVRPSTMVEEYRLEGERIAATLSSGEQLVVDGVLIGIGVVPAVGLAAQCLLDLAMGGVAVDSQLRTSDPAISAIGDIAAYESVLHGERTRIEHWDVARSQGAHVARRLAGEDPGDYDVVPYFFSGMGDWAYAEYLGIGAGDTIMRSAPEASTLSAAYVDDQDVLRGVIVVGTPDDLEAARTLVPRGVRVDRALVASGAPLDTCVVDVESLA